MARGAARIELSEEALAAVAASRDFIDDLAAKPEPVYGVSTGFGALAVRHISPELRAQLQRNIVRSHAAGMGPRVEREVVRALMFLRLKTLASGHTGVPPAGRRDDGRPPQRRASPPSSTSTARSAAPATSRRSRTVPWR